MGTYVQNVSRMNAGKGPDRGSWKGVTPMLKGLGVETEEDPTKMH